MVNEEELEELQRRYKEIADKVRKWLQEASSEAIVRLRTEHPDVYDSWFISILREVREEKATNVMSQLLSPDAFEVLSENDHVAVFINLEDMVEVATLVRIVDGLSKEFGVPQEKFVLYSATPKEGSPRIELGFEAV